MKISFGDNLLNRLNDIYNERMCQRLGNYYFQNFILHETTMDDVKEQQTENVIHFCVFPK